MNRLIIVAAGALALSGCTGTHIKKPAVCDGKHRRPANIYGSILPTLPVPLPASQAGGQSMVAPALGPGPGPGPGALPAPPPAPAVPVPTPAPDPSPGPGASGTPATSPAPGTTSAVPKASQTSRRDIAPPYYSC